MKQHYYKIITLCGFLIYLLNVGIPSTSFNVFQPYLVALPGVGDTSGSIIIGTRAGVSFVAMFFTAIYYKKLDVRKGVFFASLLTTIGFFIFSMANNLPLLLLAATIAGIGYGLGGVVAATLLINRWYKSNIGKAMGLATLGSGVVSVVLSPIVAQVIKASSLSTAFFMEAILALVITITLGVLVRSNPEDIGLSPFMLPGEAQNASSNTQEKQLSGRAFAALTVAMVAVGCSAIGSASYFSILLTSEGIDLISASLFVSLFGAALTVGKMVFGILFDKLGSRKTTIILYVVFFTGLIFCTQTGYVNNPLFTCLAALFTGLGASTGSIGLSVWSIKFSPQDNFTKSVRTLQTAYAFGGFVFMFVPGPLMDLVGNYTISYALMLLFALVAGAIILTLHIKYQRN